MNEYDYRKLWNLLITECEPTSVYSIDVNNPVMTQSRMSILKGIVKGETAISERRIFSHTQARGRLSKWLK